MPALVSFQKPLDMNLGPFEELGFGRGVAYEVVTVPGQTARKAVDGEVAVIVNTEDTTVLFATGSAPNATAASETRDTTAAMPMPIGQASIVRLRAGDFIAFDVT